MASQLTQPVLPASPYLPAGHRSQGASSRDPEPHAPLSTEPAGQLLRHTEHADAPAIAENLPASHSRHSPWPAPALYRPGGQLAHELVPSPSAVKPALHPTEQLRLPGGAAETYSVFGPSTLVQTLHALYTHTHTHTHMHACTHTHTHTSTHTHTHTHTDTHNTHTHIYIYKYIHAICMHIKCHT